MIYHILNGDGLAHDFDIVGSIVVCREALIEGDVAATSLDELWRKRHEFFENEYSSTGYFDKTVVEFSKITNVKSEDEVHLWFGDDVFCQVNMWFCVSLIDSQTTKVNRIVPDASGWNCGFTNHQCCFENRVLHSEEDISLIKKLWKAFSSKNTSELLKLSKTASRNFPKLHETCVAIVDIERKPIEILGEIKSEGISDFSTIFNIFKEQGGVYGFGDSQVRRLLKKF